MNKRNNVTYELAHLWSIRWITRCFLERRMRCFTKVVRLRIIRKVLRFIFTVYLQVVILYELLYILLLCGRIFKLLFKLRQGRSSVITCASSFQHELVLHFNIRKSYTCSRSYLRNTQRTLSP